MATKKESTTNLFPLLFCCCFWIQDPGWIKIVDPKPDSELFGQVGFGIIIPDTSLDPRPDPTLFGYLTNAYKSFFSCILYTC